MGGALLKPGTLLLWTLRNPWLVFLVLMYTSSLRMSSSPLTLLIVAFWITSLAGWVCLWFRHVYFEYHAKVRLRFKLSCGLGESWTRDGGIPQGCPLSMVFIVALYLPWCRHLETFRGAKPQLYADNLKCVSGEADDLLEAARFTNTYIRLVGQAPASSKCILLSTSAEVRGAHERLGSF